MKKNVYLLIISFCLLASKNGKTQINEDQMGA